MSQPISLRRANKWRASLNPLRGFAIQRAVSLLEDGERGIYADLQWAYRFAEKRNATLRALKRLRLAAISKLDWDIKQRSKLPRGTEQLAQEQQAALREAYERIENLKASWRFVALAEFRGFAHLERRYQGDDPSQAVVRLEPVEQWFWCRDTYLGPWQYNPEARSTVRGEPIDTRHFLIREVDDPINEIALLALASEGLGRKDWAGFIEVFGIPSTFGELPPDVTDPAKIAEYQAMMEAVIADMRGTIPHGAKVHTFGTEARGVNPFRDFLEFLKEETVLAGTSGKLTMLNGPTGLGSGQSEVHQDTFDELAQAEAGEISELFQAQFDKPLLEPAFPGQPILAYFEIAAKDTVDVGQVLDHATKAKQAGLQLDAAEVAEKTGYKVTVAPVAPAPAFGAAPSLGIYNRIRNRESAAKSIGRLEAAKRATFAPLLDLLTHIQAAKDPAAYADAIAAFQAEAKRLTPKLLGDDTMAKALETIMAEAAAEGAVETLKRSTR